jgi:hypothetical protein
MKENLRGHLDDSDEELDKTVRTWMKKQCGVLS